MKTLADYITEHGDQPCALLFGAKLRTVASWRRGERRPRAEQARRIIDATRGEVGYEGIFGHLAEPCASPQPADDCTDDCTTCAAACDCRRAERRSREVPIPGADLRSDAERRRL